MTSNNQFNKHGNDSNTNDNNGRNRNGNNDDGNNENSLDRLMFGGRMQQSGRNGNDENATNTDRYVDRMMLRNRTMQQGRIVVGNGNSFSAGATTRTEGLGPTRTLTAQVLSETIQDALEIIRQAEEEFGW